MRSQTVEQELLTAFVAESDRESVLRFCCSLLEALLLKGIHPQRLIQVPELYSLRLTDHRSVVEPIRVGVGITFVRRIAGRYSSRVPVVIAARWGVTLTAKCSTGGGYGKRSKGHLVFLRS